MPRNPTVVLPELPTRLPPSPIGDAGFGPTLPLRGITILAVEDSRFASEALRLMCQRLGARLRRAETIHQAKSHLRLYKPDVAIIDLGLPDGRGEALIREIRQSPHATIVLGTSGDPAGRDTALTAGADGFLEKPLESLAAFQSLLLDHLPDRSGAALDPQDPLAPDSLALRDDLAKAAELIDAGLTAESGAYLTGFLSGIAAHSHDPDLAAALVAAKAPEQRLASIRPLLARRLAMAEAGFGHGPGRD